MFQGMQALGRLDKESAVRKIYGVKADKDHTGESLRPSVDHQKLECRVMRFAASISRVLVVPQAICNYVTNMCFCTIRWSSRARSGCSKHHEVFSILVP